MNKRIGISLPIEILLKMEKDRKKTDLNRSQLFLEALVNFLGLKNDVEKKQENKYAAIYKSLEEHDVKSSREMMSELIKKF
jgi:metal-responsive CopG/Arc/MetJ family transcriptional regulator